MQLRVPCIIGLNEFYDSRHAEWVKCDKTRQVGEWK